MPICSVCILTVFFHLDLSLSDILKVQLIIKDSLVYMKSLLSLSNLAVAPLSLANLVI